MMITKRYSCTQPFQLLPYANYTSLAGLHVSPYAFQKMNVSLLLKFIPWTERVVHIPTRSSVNPVRDNRVNNKNHML